MVESKLFHPVWVADRVAGFDQALLNSLPVLCLVLYCMLAYSFFNSTQPVGLDGVPLTPQPKQKVQQVVKDMARNMGSKSL